MLFLNKTKQKKGPVMINIFYAVIVTFWTADNRLSSGGFNCLLPVHWFLWVSWVKNYMGTFILAQFSAWLYTVFLSVSMATCIWQTYWWLGCLRIFVKACIYISSRSASVTCHTPNKWQWHIRCEPLCLPDSSAAMLFVLRVAAWQDIYRWTWSDFTAACVILGKHLWRS